MGIQNFLKDHRFDLFFSFILGFGIICILRPLCNGSECNVNKAPAEKDFDKYVYRLGNKCYEFKTDIVQCPSSGAIEAFREYNKNIDEVKDEFKRRNTPIMM
jgi:hypothetical protein